MRIGYPIHYNYKTIKKTKMIKKQFDSIQAQSLLLYNFLTHYKVIISGKDVYAFCKSKR